MRKVTLAALIGIGALGAGSIATIALVSLEDEPAPPVVAPDRPAAARDAAAVRRNLMMAGVPPSQATVPTAPPAPIAMPMPMPALPPPTIVAATPAPAPDAVPDDPSPAEPHNEAYAHYGHGGGRR